MIHDAAPVPGTRTGSRSRTRWGISIVDIDTRDGRERRRRVGRSASPSARRTDGQMIAYGLVGRVAPPARTRSIACTGTSSMVTVDVDAPAVAAPKRAAAGGLAISRPHRRARCCSRRCRARARSRRSRATSRVAQPTLTKFADLDRAAVLTVAGERVWAAGPACLDATLRELGRHRCRARPTRRPRARRAAHRRTTPWTTSPTAPISSCSRSRSPAACRSRSTCPSRARRSRRRRPGEAARPGAALVRHRAARSRRRCRAASTSRLVTTSNYYIQQLSQGANDHPALPRRDHVGLAAAGHGEQLDRAARAHAVRAESSGPAERLPELEVRRAAGGENSTFGDYIPLSVGALFGAR